MKAYPNSVSVPAYLKACLILIVCGVFWVLILSYEERERTVGPSPQETEIVEYLKTSQPLAHHPSDLVDERLIFRQNEWIGGERETQAGNAIMVKYRYRGPSKFAIDMAITMNDSAQAIERNQHYNNVHNMQVSYDHVLGRLRLDDEQARNKAERQGSLAETRKQSLLAHQQQTHQRHTKKEREKLAAVKSEYLKY